jgi:organic hydroperoxide reductase OsmC/OhrA
VPVRAKRFEYAIAVDRTGRLTAEGEGRLDPEEVWTADHLLLAALARCVIESLRFHAARAGLDVVASAEASGVVTKREDDGRYAFVEIECALDVELDTTPAAADLNQLIELAERDCFVGASLTAPPRYRWRVNGDSIGNVEP